MKHRILLIILTAYSLQLTANAAAAGAVTARELLANPEQYDGKEISYKGEVIGDIIGRGDCAWINVLDETGAIGVFCPRDLLGGIQRTGDYQSRGDMVSAHGVFHRACLEHGGDTDIHAEKIIVISKGAAITHSLDEDKVKISLTLAAIVLVLASIHLIVRRFR